MVRNIIKRALRSIYLEDFAKDLRANIARTTELLAWHFKRGFGRTDKRIIETYFSEQSVRKLHIGCGRNFLDSWLNSDRFPTARNNLHLDATEQFPFANEQFDYIFSEHMIEHISYEQGIRMLSECYRVLKKNGKIRISTPNLAFLIDLYATNKSELQISYIKWSAQEHPNLRTAPYPDDAFVINNFVRDWGHKFIYDEKTLRSAFERAGFSRIAKYNLNECEDSIFRNLENETRLPEGFLRLETITLEGCKQ